MKFFFYIRYMEEYLADENGGPYVPKSDAVFICNLIIKCGELAGIDLMEYGDSPVTRQSMVESLGELAYEYLPLPPDFSISPSTALNVPTAGPALGLSPFEQHRQQSAASTIRSNQLPSEPCSSKGGKQQSSAAPASEYGMVLLTNIPNSIREQLLQEKPGYSTTEKKPLNRLQKSQAPAGASFVGRQTVGGRDEGRASSARAERSFRSFLKPLFSGVKGKKAEPIADKGTKSKMAVHTASASTETKAVQAAPKYRTISFRAVQAALEGNHRRISVLEFESCRNCTGQFTYVLSPGKKITVLIGTPAKSPYKAISFVWGKSSPLPSRCKGCQRPLHVPASGVGRFLALMQLAGPDTAVWLDILSIDQNSHEDMAHQVVQMGQTYGRARCVSVLLPHTDRKAFHLLSAILFSAHVMLLCFDDFRHNKDRIVFFNVSIGHFCRAFFANISIFEQNLGSWAYWRRAWTFQEWTLANELEIACEGSEEFPILQSVKSIIFRAAVMVANYKIQNGQYANIKPGFSRGEMNRRFEGIKRLFTYEDYLLTSEEVNETKSAYQTLLPARFGTEQVLGIRLKRRQARLYPDLPETTNVELDLQRLIDIKVDLLSLKSDDDRAEIAARIYGWNILNCHRGLGPYIRPFQRAMLASPLQETVQMSQVSRSCLDWPKNTADSAPDGPLRARLLTMLASFGTHTREARFDADLVACWASMCGLHYGYQKEDRFAFALQKAIVALRERGIKVYNFQVNTEGASGEIDLCFLQYSAPHRQCNSKNGQQLQGSPAFNGRADVGIHFYYSMNQPINKMHLQGCGVPLRKLFEESAWIHKIISLADIEEVLQIFQRINQIRPTDPLEGNIFVDSDVQPDKIDGLFLSNLHLHVQKILESMSETKRRSHCLVVVLFDTKHDPSNPGPRIGAWAICQENAPFQDLFVAREGLNGTFVLAAANSETEERASRIVAYLVMNDQESGCYLLESDENGRIEMVTQPVWRSDMLHTGFNTPCMKFFFTIKLKDRVLHAF